MNPTTTLQLRLWRKRRARYITVVHALHAQHAKPRVIAKWQRKANQADAKVRALAGHAPPKPAKIPRKLQPHAKPPTTGERAWAALTPLLGVHEVGGNNMGPIVNKIITANGGQIGEPWCGDTVAWAYRHAGSRVVTRAWAAVSYLGYLTGMRVIGTASARLGDIICFRWDHTGLFGWWSDSHGRPVPRHTASHFVTREGNTSRTGAVHASDSSGGDVLDQKLHQISDAVGARFVHVYR